jgi:histidinol phosphatase-like PHP family hydrolase
MIDFHTHTIFSDGELIPSELIQRAVTKGYKTIAITDHVDATNLEHILQNLQKIKPIQHHYNIQLLIGVELTHVPPPQIQSLAAKARNMGAELIIVHGETPVEPVPEGTNHAALQSDIDILAHPGFITPEDTQLAAAKNIYLEITSRCGHNLTNGHVARAALEYGAKLLVNTDTHAPQDLITAEEAFNIALGAGLTRGEAEKTMKNSQELVDRIIKQKSQ